MSYDLFGSEEMVPEYLMLYLQNIFFLNEN